MRFLCALAAVSIFALVARSSVPATVRGRVLDGRTHAPIAGAIVTAGSRTVRSNASGDFTIDASQACVLRARAQGYLRLDVPVGEATASPVIRLQPFVPKAVYLSVYGVGSRRLRTAALRLIEQTELNAIVIDMKGDRGIVPYRSHIPLAAEVGAQKVITIEDLSGLMAVFHRSGIYTIARIVVFKDNLLAAGRPALAIRTSGGSVFHDREHLAWVNPYSRDVWAYNIALALEAARAGFDEIQFDYTRLPDARGLVYDMPWTQANRTAAVDGFLLEAGRALAPHNVFLAVDVFGYVCWNTNDTMIGQRIEDVVSIADYVAPMLYPSGFRFGIPGYRNPVQHPYEIVRLSLEQARRRTGVPSNHFRPWLQAFRDYAFGGHPFTAAEVKAQINAATAAGSDGWMLWNPRNQYSADGLEPRQPCAGR